MRFSILFPIIHTLPMQLPSCLSGPKTLFMSMLLTEMTNFAALGANIEIHAPTCSGTCAC